MYLQTLAKQGLDKKAKPRDVKPGDLVIFREPGMPREDWNLARILKILPGPDGITRKVEVVYARDESRSKTGKRQEAPKTFIRAVENLVHLELSDDDKRRAG